MKKLALALLLMAFVLPAAPLLAESPPVSARESLMLALDKYKKATLARNVETMVAMLYPPMFEIMPRKVLIKTLKTIYADDKAPVVKAIEWLDVGKIGKYAKGHFALVSYLTTVEMRRPTDADADMDKSIVESFKQRMGAATKVDIDKDKGIVTVKQKAVLVAINEDQAGWKIIGKDSLPAMVKSGLLPGEIADMMKIWEAPKTKP